MAATITTAARAAAEAHAARDYPREACGLLVIVRRRMVYWPCRNLSTSPGEQFVMAADDYAAAEDAGTVVGIVHSHPDANCAPSEADRVACEASGLPWHIISWPGAQWAQIEPIGYIAPLVGRPFVHGVLDCYALVRDYYAERGIRLPDYRREDEWWRKGQNLYLDHYAAAGFVRIDGPPQPHDSLLMQVLADVPNHAAVYLGDGHILHHLYGRLSCREVYGGYWQKHTTHVLRYAA